MSSTKIRQASMQLMYGLLVLVTLGVVSSFAQSSDDAKTHAISDPEDVANPPLSWVCLDPQTRRYRVLKAASIQQAQQSVAGDSTTPCKAIPAALDPERVAQELNTQDTR